MVQVTPFAISVRGTPRAKETILADPTFFREAAAFLKDNGGEPFPEEFPTRIVRLADIRRYRRYMQPRFSAWAAERFKLPPEEIEFAFAALD